MADSHKDDLQALTGIIRELREEVRESRENRRPGSTSSIKIDTGGASAWLSSRVSAYCCMFLVGLSIGMTGMVIMGWMRLATLESSVNANKAYLAAIFQKVPELKQEIDNSKGLSK